MQRPLALILSIVLLAPTATAPATTIKDAPTPSGFQDVDCEAVQVNIENPDGQTAATIHAYAYTTNDDPNRPITFLWNGGPGASAALLQTGFASPINASLGTDGDGTLYYNNNTLIDLTNLVYVDPIGTGLSRTQNDHRQEEFWGVTEDAQAAASFVFNYLSERNLLERPIYLCGESYGAIRVAAMLEPLQQLGITAEGIILISPALESRTLRPKRNSQSARTARADKLPTYAALAVNHGTRNTNDPKRFIEDARQFAHGPYLQALQSDKKPTPETIKDLKEQRDRFTDKPNTSSQDKYDARFTQSDAAISGVVINNLGTALQQQLRDVFDIETDGRYILMNPNTNIAWRAPDGSPGISRADIRATAMIAKASKDGNGPRLFIAGGWYDLVTPFAISHRLNDEHAFGNCDVEVRDYPAGHVIYADADAHNQLASDLREWFTNR